MLPEFYNTLFTMHATIMIFFVIMPILIGVLRQLPDPADDRRARHGVPDAEHALVLDGGARRGVIMLASFFVPGGAAAAGWTSYAPLSPCRRTPASTGARPSGCISLIILGVSSLMGSVNYITTIINMRAPGHDFFRLPLTIWALFITAILLLLALPVLTGGADHAALRPRARHDFFLPAGWSFATP